MNRYELLASLQAQDFPLKIIKAFTKVKREEFISPDLESLAYTDNPLPIGHDQTISQPFTVALMLTLLEIKDNQKILEIGSGSGYVLALMNELGKSLEIYGVERINQLAEKSQARLKKYPNIKIVNKDGSLGLQDKAPFDRIIVSASYDEIPYHLIDQLKDRGILIVPVENSLYKIERKSRENKITEIPGFIFVPIIQDKEK